MRHAHWRSLRPDGNTACSAVPVPCREAATRRVAPTRPKRDRWLVRTVGPLLAGFGLLLLDEARSTSVSPAAAKAVAGSAVILAGVDVRYGGPGRISRVYLLDAVVEVVLALAWAAARNR